VGKLLCPCPCLGWNGSRNMAVTSLTLCTLSIRRGVVTDDGRTDAKRWNLLEGQANGQTQVDTSQVQSPQNFGPLLKKKPLQNIHPTRMCRCRAHARRVCDVFGIFAHDFSPGQGGDISVWSHPIDLHYATTSIHGWPKFHCEVKSAVTSLEYSSLPCHVSHPLCLALFRSL
jgi:hypothetical protein